MADIFYSTRLLFVLFYACSGDFISQQMRTFHAELVLDGGRFVTPINCRGQQTCVPLVPHFSTVKAAMVPKFIETIM
jgi:hypothetical protein